MRYAVYNRRILHLRLKWKRGIRVGRLADGEVLYLIPDPLDLHPTSAAEGLAVDKQGNIYGGEVGPRQLSKHVK